MSSPANQIIKAVIKNGKNEGEQKEAIFRLRKQGD
jgi:hypothetical protein